MKRRPREGWRILAALLVFGVLIVSHAESNAVLAQEGARIVRQGSPSTIDSDLRVQRGLVLSRHPSAHLISLQKWELSGLPRVDGLQNEARLRLAIKEFRLALRNRAELQGYTASQVHGFLGRALMLLAVDLRRSSEQVAARSRGLETNVRTYFQRSFHHYREALRNPPEGLKYYIAEDLVSAVIASGDLNKALAVIRDFERKQLKPNPTVDHRLIRIKGEIYWLMGRYEDAGLAFEEWISRGRADADTSLGSILYEKLHYLRGATGHPLNLPSKAAAAR